MSEQFCKRCDEMTGLSTHICKRCGNDEFYQLSIDLDDCIEEVEECGWGECLRRD